LLSAIFSSWRSLKFNRAGPLTAFLRFLASALQKKILIFQSIAWTFCHDARSSVHGYRKEVRMLSRSLTLAILFAVSSPLLAADSDTPLGQERGRSRPLIIIASSSVDPTLVSLKKSLDEPANKEAFAKRSMVLYTIVNMIGQRNGKDMDAQSTMALIRDLKLGARPGDQAQVILVGKDGETKIDHKGNIDPKEIFSTIDQMPMAEKEAAAPAPVAPAAEPKSTAQGGKPGKGGKAAPAAPAAQPDD
jgi:hypothetical protein